MTRYPSDVPGTDISTVELFDNGAPKGVFTTANGHWSTTPIDVAPGFHSFTAQGRYGSEPISPARTFQVAAVVTPTLTDIRDSRRSIVGGTTVDTAVIVEGTGSLGQLIQLMDGAEAIGNPFRVPADQTKWSTTLAGLNVKAYNLKARALYGNGVPDSTAKGFIVAPALDFGATYSMVTQNYIVARHRVPNQPIPTSNASYTRAATGGVPPYRYSSASPQIAVVDIDTGYVRAVGNGSAQISVSDLNGDTAAYTVSVSGVMPVVLLAGVTWGQGGVLEEAAYDILIANYRPEGHLSDILGWPNTWYRARRGHVDDKYGYVKNLAGTTGVELKSTHYPAVQHVAARADMPVNIDVAAEQGSKSDGA